MQKEKLLKKSITQLHKILWELCKQIVRAKYPPVCYTCGKYLQYPKDQHTAHGKPKSALSLKYRYDLRNLRICCYNCNVNLGGATDIFITKLEKEKEGLEFLKEACVKTKEGWKIKGTTIKEDSKMFLIN